MTRTPRRPRRDGEAGFTLIELLVVLLLVSVIGSITMSGMVSAMRAQRRQVDQTQTLNTAKQALERISRELRGANPLMTAEPQRVKFVTTQNGVKRTLTYATVATGGTMRLDLTEVRTTVATGVTTTSTATVLSGLKLTASDAVFAFYDATGAALVPVTASPVTYQASSARTVTVRLKVNRAVAGGVADLYQRVSLRNSEG